MHSVILHDGFSGGCLFDGSVEECIDFVRFHCPGGEIHDDNGKHYPEEWYVANGLYNMKDCKHCKQGKEVSCVS